MTRRTAWLLVAIVVVAFGLRVWGLSAQTPTSDDLGVAYSAGNWVNHGQADPIMPDHPRLRDFMVAASLALFGPTALGLKGWSLLLGTLCVPLIAGVVWRLTKNPIATLLAAVLLAVDGVSVDYSRQAIQEVHVTFFLLLGTYLVVTAIVKGPARSWRWLLPLAGVAFGLGTASKFYAIPPLLVSVAWLLWDCWKRRTWEDALFVVTSLVGVSFLVYFLTYAPWFGRGYGLWDWVLYQRAVIEAMVTHTRDFGFVKFPEPSMWFVQPFTGFADFVVDPSGAPHLAVATGNPLVWLAVLPAVVYSFVLKRRRGGHQILQSYLWAGYLPLALSPRPVWVLSAIAVVPFAIALVAMVVADIGRRVRSWIPYAYVAVVVVTSLLLYPLAIGRALDVPYLKPIVAQMEDAASQAQSGGGAP